MFSGPLCSPGHLSTRPLDGRPLTLRKVSIAFNNIKNFRQNRAALKTANSIVARKTSRAWLFQLTAVVTLGLLSLLSLDSRSKNWIEGIENDRKKQLAEGIAIHPASFCNLPRFYRALHKRTMISRLGLIFNFSSQFQSLLFDPLHSYSESELGLLDALPLSEDSKISLLFWLVRLRSCFL